MFKIYQFKEPSQLQALPLRSMPLVLPALVFLQFELVLMVQYGLVVPNPFHPFTSLPLLLQDLSSFLRAPPYFQNCLRQLSQQRTLKFLLDFVAIPLYLPSNPKLHRYSFFLKPIKLLLVLISYLKTQPDQTLTIQFGSLAAP